MKKLCRLFLIILGVSFHCHVQAQENGQLDLSGEINWSIIRTELEKEALGFAAEITPKVNEERYFSSMGGAGYLGPTVAFKAGGNDSFESFVAKVSGFYMLEPPPDEDGEPNTKARINVFPFSIGIEADRNFNTPAVLAELGWTPIGSRKPIDPNDLAHSERFGLDPMRSLGIFAQLGYKFNNESNPAGSPAQGGNVDQSAEKPNEAIARIKGELKYGLALSNSLSVTPKAIGWYDIKNGETYYKIEALMRIIFVKDKYALDFKYEKGSGPPNFNEGDQFSTGLTLAF